MRHRLPWSRTELDKPMPRTLVLQSHNWHCLYLCSTVLTVRFKSFLHIWPNTTKGTSCLLLKKLRLFALYITEDLAFQWYQIHKKWSDTLENTRFSKCEFIFTLFTFYTLFCSLSENKPGRQNVPFVVLGHTHIYFACFIRLTATSTSMLKDRQTLQNASGCA